MTRQEKISLWEIIVGGIVDDYQRLDGACVAAIKAGCMEPNGPLHEAVWRAFDGMLDRIDEEGWINWFIYDNKCGEKEMKAKIGEHKKAKTVKTTRHIATLIVDSVETPKP